MSLGAAPNANGDEVSPLNGDSITTSAPPPVLTNPNAKAVHDVVNSEIGVATLLNRLKQSIASAKVGLPLRRIKRYLKLILCLGICNLSQETIHIGRGTFERTQEAL